MVYSALTAFLNRNEALSGVTFTAVLPGGCPAKCKFCIVNMREEGAPTSHLTSRHYDTLLRMIGPELSAASIVGDEALWGVADLVDGTFNKYTLPFFRTANELTQKLAVVTNGLELAQAVPKFIENGLRHLKLIVSVDAVGEQHDKMRRLDGLFSALDNGVRKALLMKMPVYIGTILHPPGPGNSSPRDNIFAVIEQVAKWNVFAKANGVDGIQKVEFSPLLTSQKDMPLRASPASLRSASEYLPEAQRLANSLGVKIAVGDEMQVASDWLQEMSALGVSTEMPNDIGSISRLDAKGRLVSLEGVHKGVPSLEGAVLPEHVPANVLEIVKAIPQMGIFLNEEDIKTRGFTLEDVHAAFAFRYVRDAILFRQSPSKGASRDLTRAERSQIPHSHHWRSELVLE